MQKRIVELQFEICNPNPIFSVYQHAIPMKTLLIVSFITSFLFAQAQKIDFDKKLRELGIELPPPSKPMANYVRAVRTGNLLYLAGTGPTKADGSNITGKV